MWAIIAAVANVNSQPIGVIMTSLTSLIRRRRKRLLLCYKTFVSAVFFPWGAFSRKQAFFLSFILLYMTFYVSVRNRYQQQNEKQPVKMPLIKLISLCTIDRIPFHLCVSWPGCLLLLAVHAADVGLNCRTHRVLVAYQSTVCDDPPAGT